MTDLAQRTRRQKMLADLIRGEPIASQEDLTARLAAEGLVVTQATVSRDLDHLGAVKVKRRGLLSYALPDQMGDGDWAATRLQQILGEWVQAVEPAGSLIVLRTPPGSAHLVALAIDQAKLPEIAGTVAGDDTLFLAVRDGFAMPIVVDQFRALAGQNAAPAGRSS
jgi:transcriptional regulator of arginine metabolism